MGGILTIRTSKYDRQAQEKALKSDQDETTQFQPKFNERGLIPVIAQDARSGEILMMAWMNQTALDKTLQTGEVHYWSRTKDALWKKGETSGNIQILTDILIDCDQDTILLKIEQTGGGACHTGRSTCFYRRLGNDPDTKTYSLTFVKD